MILFGIAALGLILVVAGLLGWWGGASGSRRAHQRIESAQLRVSPDFVCPTGNCVVEVAFSVSTNASAPSARLSVRTPRGQTVEFTASLNGALSLPGDDPVFSDGPGVYTFVYEVTNLEGNDITRRDDVTVMAAKRHVTGITSAVTFLGNSTVYERMTARDVVVLGATRDGKGRRRLTFCEKTTTLSHFRYLSGGIAGYADELTVSIFNLATGQLVAAATLSPGHGLEVVPQVLMSDGAAIEMAMSAYTRAVGPAGNAFPIGSTLVWTAEVGLDCN